jgi:peptidoglycan/xylan/chitin deacetylase (PgdA/CDA1 family)
VNPAWIAAPSALALGAGVAAWGAFHPGSQLFGPTLRHTPRANDIALTFDDGPNPAVTPQLLDLLDRHSARATFFVIGRFVRECPDLVREIAARGHALGNHTDTHPALTFLSARRIEQELSRCQGAIASALGSGAAPPLWMRPPYGFRGPQLRGAVRSAGLRRVAMWSVIGYDWKPQPPEKLIARLARVGKSRRWGGDIVLLHDGDHRALNGDRRHVVAALEHCLPRWREAGREFVTINALGEMPHDSP